MDKNESLFLNPPISRLIADAPREEWLHALSVAHPSLEFRIGIRTLGPTFRHEWPEFEIVSEYRPVLRSRAKRYAVYARRRGQQDV